MALNLADLLTAHENSKVEFKRDSSGLQGIVREVIAFANRTGGVVVIGVNDKTREVVGVDDPQTVEQQIAQAVYDSTVPTLVPDIVVTTDPGSGEEVVLVQVHQFQGPDPVMHTDGTCYERISSSKKKVGPERLKAMRIERRGRSSFDQLPAMAVGIDALDLDDARRRYAARGTELTDGLIRSFEIASEVNVHIFDGRLVIESPGPWVTGIDVEEVRAGHSKTRNRAITRNLHELDLIEERGTFWGKALTAHEKRGYPLPMWEDIGHSLRVILPIHPIARPERSSDSDEATVASPVGSRTRRNDRRQEIADLLANAEGAMSIGEIAAAVGLQPRQTRIWLAQMEKEGTILVEGGAAPTSPNRRYRRA